MWQKGRQLSCGVCQQGPSQYRALQADDDQASNLLYIFSAVFFKNRVPLVNLIEKGVRDDNAVNLRVNGWAHIDFSCIKQKCTAQRIFAPLTVQPIIYMSVKKLPNRPRFCYNRRNEGGWVVFSFSKVRISGDLQKAPVRLIFWWNFENQAVRYDCSAP